MIPSFPVKGGGPQDSPDSPDISTDTGDEEGGSQDFSRCLSDHLELLGWTVARELGEKNIDTQKTR